MKHSSPVVFLHAENPSAEDLVRDMKLLDQVALFEHSNCRPASVLVGQIEVDEGETVQIVGFRGRYRFRGQSQRVVVAGCRVVAQAFKSHLLLGH